MDDALISCILFEILALTRQSSPSQLDSRFWLVTRARGFCFVGVVRVATLLLLYLQGSDGWNGFLSGELRSLRAPPPCCPETGNCIWSDMEGYGGICMDVEGYGG